jgi:hypothetical protein
MRILVLILAFVTVTLGITYDRKEVHSNDITAAVAQAAKTVAAEFDMRLARTKDIGLVMSEMFVDDVLGHFSAEPDGFPLAVFQRGITAQLPRDELLKYYALTMNSYYLSSLYLATKVDFSTGDRADLSPAQLYPPGIFTMLQSNPAIVEQMNAPDGKIKSAQQLRQLLPTLERAVTTMRSYLNKHPVARSRLYKKNLAFLNTRDDVLHPWVTQCDQPCYGFPIDTRLIRITTSFIQLLMVREQNKLKIVSANPHTK